MRRIVIVPGAGHAGVEQLRTKLIACGRKYAELAKVPFSHRMFCGKSFFLNKNSDVVVRYAESCSMLDPNKFAKHPPGKSRIPPAVRIRGDMAWDMLEEDERLLRLSRSRLSGNPCSRQARDGQATLCCFST